MSLTAEQITALDREPDHDPALQPSDGSEPTRMGTVLADMADAIAAVPDASDLATAQTLVNAIKAEIVAAFGRI
jgi:hypothetical protein